MDGFIIHMVQVFDGTSPVAVAVSPGANMLPSVVAFTEEDEVSVGVPAKRCRPTLKYSEESSFFL